ncbi:MAG: sialidase family protein, partial [Polyangiaceae bacterium]
MEVRGLLLVACVLAGCSSNSSSNASNPAGSSVGADAGTSAAPTTPVQIAATAQSIYQTEPTVAIAPNGTVAVAWLDLEPATATVGFAFSQDRGDTWGDSQLMTLPNGAFASNEILVADPQSNFYLVTLAVSSDQTSSKVLVAKAAAGQSTFGPLIEASNPASPLPRDASAMSIAQDQSLNVVYAEYADTTYQTSIVVSSRSTDGGATWTRTPLNTQGAFGWTNGCASRTSEKVAAVFLDYTKEDASVRWSDDNGATWPEANETDISPDENPGEFPSCVADGTDLWLLQGVTHEQASTTVEPTLDGIKLSHSSDGGHTFDPAVMAQDPAAGSKYMRSLATVQGDG